MNSNYGTILTGGEDSHPRFFSSLEGHKKRTENAKSERKTVRIFSKALIINANCGEAGIRTRDTLLGYTRFPGVPLKPLEHLSNFGRAKICIFPKL